MASRAKSAETDLKKSVENFEEVKEDVRDEPIEEKEIKPDEWGEISKLEAESKDGGKK